MLIRVKGGRFVRHDGDKRVKKVIRDHTDLLDAVPDPAEFAKLLQHKDTQEQFEMWVGSIKTKRQRKDAYRRNILMCLELARLEAARN